MLTVLEARYAKNQMAVHCESDGSGMKTRAMRLCCALKARYSHRERAYIMSKAKAAELQRLFAAGRDAGFITGELYPPKGLKEKEIASA